MEKIQLTDSQKLDVINQKVKNIQRVQFVQGAIALLVAFGIMAAIVSKVKEKIK